MGHPACAYVFVYGTSKFESFKCSVQQQKHFGLQLINSYVGPCILMLGDVIGFHWFIHVSSVPSRNRVVYSNKCFCECFFTDRYKQSVKATVRLWLMLALFHIPGGGQGRA